MENQNMLLWVVSIVAVVGIVAMVIAATRTGSVGYSAAPQLQYATDTSTPDTSAPTNMAGNAMACGRWYQMEGNSMRDCVIGNARWRCTFTAAGGTADCSFKEFIPVFIA